MEQGTRIPAAVEPVVPLLAYQQADVESNARFTWFGSRGGLPA